MSLRNLSELLKDAQKKKYAVGAFNAVDSHFARAVIEAAAEKNSPVILNIAEVHFDYSPPELMVPLYRAIADSLGVSITINLDHGTNINAIIRAIKTGFNSVMFDGSMLPYKSNLEGTKEIVNMCHAQGISVEAELGSVSGEEGGGLIGSADSDLFTNPDRASEFVAETGVDALAIAIGNSHGLYKGDPKLDFSLLEELNNEIDCPLVLHGGSGISDKAFKKAISMGISKINFYTGMSQVALKTVKKGISSTGNAYNDYPLLMMKVEKKVKQIVMQQMDLFKSTGKL